MAINNSYIRPQSEVYQLLSTAISQTNGHGAACIVGSQYDVYSYEAGNASEETFNGGISLNYSSDSTGILKHEVDENSIQLYLKDVKVKLVGNITVTAEDDDVTVISAPENKYWAVDADYSGANLVVSGYSLSIGDELVTANNKSTVVLGYIANKDNPKVYDKIKVSKNIFDIGSSSYSATVSVCKIYSGAAPQKLTFNSTSGYVSYNTDANVTFVGKNGAEVKGTMMTLTGKVYAEFRVRVSYAHPESDPIMILSSVDDIVNNLGSITPQNELAYACYRAISGSQGREVYAVRVHEDTAEGFLTAMQKTEANDRVYAFVPVTNNTDCMDAVVEFNNTLSSPILKKWRITLVGADLDTEQKQVVDPAGKDLVGSVISAPGNTFYFEVSEGNINAGFNCNDYSVGDTIDILADGSVQESLTVTGIVAENVFAVSGATKSQTSVDFAVKRSDSAQSHVAYVSDLASKFNSRRTVVVWCDGGRSDGRIISNVYIAAEVAGLTSAVQPQQGLTNTEITTIDSATRMYTKYTQGQLDNIAAHGVMIITQDTADVTPYIRHQLTTTPDKGVLYSELSCTRNIDNISYAVADIIKAYVGKVNITPAAVDTIKGRLISLWNKFTTNSTDNLIGPSLVSYDGVRVEQDPAALDRLVVNVNYYVPSPLNRISVYQMAYVATVNL